MIKTMYIGSGDISALLAKKTTKTHGDLLKRFVSGVKPYYNAKASPIDACRIGAILEDRYFLNLDGSFLSQFKVVSTDMDVFLATIDFAKFEDGKIIDFDEMKTKNFSDFLILLGMDESSRLSYIKKHHKIYYNQIQEQLYVTELGSANMVFVAVYNYIDEDNEQRIIDANDIIKVRIHRDEDVIQRIKDGGQIFQQIKNTYRDDKDKYRETSK